MFGITGLKACVGGTESVVVKSLGLTEDLLGKLMFLRQVRVRRTLGGAVECVDIKRNASGENGALGLF